MVESREPTLADPELHVRRRGRLFAVPSGLLLFVCMFLPIVESCGEPVYPYEVPPACLPYVIGLVVALRALASPAVRASTLRGARILAGSAVAFWALATAWFAAWTFDTHAMIGAPLSLACSAWLGLAAIIRLRDLPAAAVERRRLPRAQLGALRPRVSLPVMLLFVVMLVTFAAALAIRPHAVHRHGVDDIDLSGLYGC